MNHNVGNQYELLGHTVEIQEIVGEVRCKLACGIGCCTRGAGLKVECSIDELDDLKCTKEVEDRKYVPVHPCVIDWQRGDTALIKEPWEGWGTKFIVLGPAVFLKQWWVPVESDEHGEPDFQKEASLIRVEKHGI